MRQAARKHQDLRVGGVAPDDEKTREQLIIELEHLRQVIARLETIGPGRKRKSKAAGKPSSLLEAAAEQSTEGLAVVNLDGTILAINRAFAAMHSCSPEDLIGKHLSHFHQPDMMPMVEAWIGHTLESGVFLGEFLNVRSDGTDFAGLMQSSLLKDEEGNPIGMICTLRDITDLRKATSLLERSEERFRALIEKSSDGIAVVDAHGDIVYTGPANERMLGYGPDDSLGAGILDAIHPDDVTRLSMDFIRLLQEPDSIITGLYRAKHADGSWRMLEAIGRNLTEDAQINGVVVNFRDVTERMKAEEALRESEERYRLLVESTSDLVYVLDAMGVVTYMSPQVALYGYSPNEIITRSFLEFVEPEDRERVAQDFKTSMETGAEFPAEFRILDKNGNEHWVEDVGRVRRDESGSFIWMTGMLRDITGRKRDEMVLRESEERYRLLFDNHSAPITVFDREGTLLSINTAGATNLGARPSDIIGDSIFELFPQKAGDLMERHRRIMDTGKGRSFEERFELASGERWFLSNVQPARDAAGEIYGVMIISHDITSHKQAEQEAARTRQLEELDRLKSALLASVSHELRTPLAAIKGIADTLIQPDVEWDRETEHDFLRTINRESDRLTHIVSDLVHMSQLEAGVMQIKKMPSMLSAIMIHLKDELRNLAEEHELKVDIPRDLPPIDMDEVRIGEVITNLVSNAAAYSEKGTPITLRAMRVGDEVVVSVTDQGIGISVDQQEKVFDRFYRLDSGIACRRGGTGLGLAICREIISQHGGRIWVESEAGQGSTFSFSLPVAEDTEYGNV